MSDVEKTVRHFYDDYGWKEISGASGEDLLFRQFSVPYQHYHESVNARTMNCFANLSGKLLMAGAGDLPETHVAIAQKFSSTTCLDISSKSLEIARSKLTHNAEYILGSILDIQNSDDHFDAIYCAHVIYHIDRDLQEKAVRELIRVTRPGGRIVIIYSNPNSMPRRIAQIRKIIPIKIQKLRNRKPDNTDWKRPALYFFAYPLEWWSQFGKECEIKLIPWDVMGSKHEKQLLPHAKMARSVYRCCSWFEKNYPEKAVQWWSYPVIVLTKKIVSMSISRRIE